MSNASNTPRPASGALPGKKGMHLRLTRAWERTVGVLPGTPHMYGARTHPSHLASSAFLNKSQWWGQSSGRDNIKKELVIGFV